MIRFVPRAAIVLPATFAAFAAVAAPALVNLAAGRPMVGGGGGAAPVSAVARAPEALAATDPAAVGIVPTRVSARFARAEGGPFRIGDTPLTDREALVGARGEALPALVPEFSLVRQDAGQFPSLAGVVAARLAASGVLGAGAAAGGVGGSGGTVIGRLTAAIAPADLGAAGGLADAVVAPVPEPEVWAMLVFGLGVVTWRARRVCNVECGATRMNREQGA